MFPRSVDMNSIGRGSTVSFSLPVHAEQLELGMASAPVELAAYYTAIEALTNIAKHAHARRADAAVLHDEARLRLASAELDLIVDAEAAPLPPRAAGPLADLELATSAYEQLLEEAPAILGVIEADQRGEEDGFAVTQHIDRSVDERDVGT